MKLDDINLFSDLQNMEPTRIKDELNRLNINLSVLYQELEMSSRFVDTHMDTSFGDIPVQLHSHNFYEVVYVTSNSGTQYLVDSKRYRLQRGDVIIVPPGVGHKPLYPPQLAEPYTRIVLWLSTEFINSLKEIISYDEEIFHEKLFLLRTSGTAYEVIGNYFRNGLKEAQKKEEGWQIALYGNTMQLMTLFWRAIHDTMDTPAKSEKPELLDDIVSYIENHLGEKITLKDTAERFFVSESTISQTFQKKMHVSFYHYVTQRRLIAAKNMMAETNNLEELSGEVGFTDYSSFYRAFKKEFGISPREYRTLISHDAANM